MPARGPKIAEAYVEVHADMDKIPGEVKRGLDDQAGSFRESGRKSGEKFGDGFTTSISDRVRRDAGGRFVADGEKVGGGLAQGIRRSVTREGVPAMASAGGGLMKALSLGIRGHSAMVGAAVLAVFAALPAIGGLAATGIVTLFGAGLAGMGLAATRHTKRVETAVDRMKEHIGRRAREISTPFIETWETISRVAMRTFDRIAPSLEQMFVGIAPSLSRFIDNLGLSFERLMPGLEKLSGAFVLFLDELGPKLPGMFTQLSEGLGAVADAVSRNPEAFVALIGALFSFLEMGLRFIAWLADVWAWMYRNRELFLTLATFAVPLLMGAFSLLTGTTRVLGEAFSWLGGIFSAVGSWIANTASSIANWIGNAWQSVVNWTYQKWSQAYNWVTSRLSAIWSAAVNFGARVVAAIARAWNGAVEWTARAWSQMVSGVGRGASNVMSMVSRIPGNILSALGNLGNLLFNAGRNVVSGLIRGITSMFGSLGSTVSRMASTIRNYLPFSPAKVGPLSGGGAPEISGQRIAANLATGIQSGRSLLSAAMGQMLGPITPPAVTAAAAPAAGGGGRSVTINHLSVEMPVTLDITKSGAARAFLVDLREQLRRLEAEYA